MLLIPDEFTIANGFLTPTMKLRRRVIEDRYRPQIEQLYSEPLRGKRSLKPALSASERSAVGTSSRYVDTVQITRLQIADYQFLHCTLLDLCRFFSAHL